MSPRSMRVDRASSWKFARFPSESESRLSSKSASAMNAMATGIAAELPILCGRAG